MENKRLYIIFLAFLPSLLFSQVGGNSTYDFLNLTNSARSAALGGKIVSLPDNDLDMSFHNPALLNIKMDNNLVLNYVNYFSDINFGYVSYSRSFDNIGNFAAGIHYINYGRFTSADETGTITGNFNASEYSFNLIYSRVLPFADSTLQVGVNLKPIISNFESYTSFGLATDLGINYISRQGYFTAGLVFKNIGFQIKPYYIGNSEPLPFEIQLGVSQKLKHAPFRFILVVQQLQKFKMTTTDDGSGDSDNIYNTEKSNNNFKQFGDNLLRHFIFGVEINPIKPIIVRLGYNYQRNRELRLSSKPGMVGFTWGFGVNLSKFQISYGHARYHLAGSSNHISLALNLNEFGKKGL